jgi:hypothetical protein
MGDLADFSNADSIFAGNYYKIFEESMPGEVLYQSKDGAARPIVPFAIPYYCAHSTEEMGIVSGMHTREEVLDLIRQALTCLSPEDYAGLVSPFGERTEATYAKVREAQHHQFLRDLIEGAARFVADFIHTPQAQYDRHAQVIVRVRDQHGNPINDYSIHLNSFGGGARPAILINTLFEDTHQNKISPDTTTFYLRLEAWDGNTWADRLAQVNGVDLEIDCIDPKTERIVFLPLRMRLNAEQLARYLRPHRTTLIDVELLRLPARETFSMFEFKAAPDPEPVMPVNL